ncbi:MAG: pyrimidine 5'-nucleotidase [Geobacter sp.]|nr:MAG: pyrimidine 5'-nucleotidase [Geobacter sp.]
MDILLFDLDNTLYTPERELFTLIDQRINRYMTEVVGIPLTEVDTLRRSYWQRYGVTMQGLMRHHAVDPEDYLSYVHDIDVSSRLHPDLALRDALMAVPLRKAVFTNSSRDHSERVLNALGLNNLFEEIYDIRIANYLPKPGPEPYHAVLERINLPATACIMVEDSPENLRTAKELGMGTILVGHLPGTPHVDVRIPAAGEISSALSHWNM